MRFLGEVENTAGYKATFSHERSQSIAKILVLEYKLEFHF